MNLDRFKVKGGFIENNFKNNTNRLNYKHNRCSLTLHVELHQYDFIINILI